MQTSFILDKIPLGIIVFSDTNEILSVNDWGEEYIVKTSNYLLDIIRKIAASTLINNEAEQKIIQFNDNNNIFIWSIKTELIKDASPKVMVIIQDETVNNKLTQTILKAEKLAVRGHLAIGSLLEIRNPLTSARGFCQLIEDGDKFKKDYIEIISKELEQIQDIIENYALIDEPSPSESIESIYHKIWTCIHSKVLSCTLIMVTDAYDDMMIKNIPEEQINGMLNLIKVLNIWEEATIYIISFEKNEKSRCLKFNFGSLGRTQTFNRYKIDNSQITIQIVNNEAIITI